MPRAALAPLLVALLLAAAGCGQAGGGGGFEGEEQAVADTVSDLEEAAGDRDERRICRALLAPALAQRLGDCERRIGAVLDQSDSYELEAEDVVLQGRDRARVRVQQGRDEEADRVIVLQRSGDAWRIADLGRPARRAA